MITSLSLRVHQHIDSIGGPRLVVNETRFSKDTAPAAILAGKASPVEAVATQDGRSVIPIWHEGADSGEWIYFERFDRTGRVSHGWVDEHSRKIVQTG